MVRCRNSLLDEMLHRILRTEFATGLIDDPVQPKVVDVFHGLHVAQHVEEQGSVLLRNQDHQLPLDAGAIHSIAVIGGHADAGVISGRRLGAGGSGGWQSGGSAAGKPHRPRGPAERAGVSPLGAAGGDSSSRTEREGGVRSGHGSRGCRGCWPNRPTSRLSSRSSMNRKAAICRTSRCRTIRTRSSMRSRPRTHTRSSCSKPAVQSRCRGSIM